MAQRISRKCKRGLVVQAEQMWAVKAAKRLSLDALSLNESLPLHVLSIDEDFDADSLEESDEDYSNLFTKEEAAEIYLGWISERDKNDMRMMAVMLFDTFMQRFGLTKRGAATGGSSTQ